LSSIAIKYIFIDIVVFDYILFPIFTHTTGMTHFQGTVSVFRAIEPVNEDHQLTNNLLENRTSVKVPFAFYSVQFLNPPFLLI